MKIHGQRNLRFLVLQVGLTSPSWTVVLKLGELAQMVEEGNPNYSGKPHSGLIYWRGYNCPVARQGAQMSWCTVQMVYWCVGSSITRCCRSQANTYKRLPHSKRSLLSSHLPNPALLTLLITSLLITSLATAHLRAVPIWCAQGWLVLTNKRDTGSLSQSLFQSPGVIAG